MYKFVVFWGFIRGYDGLNMLWAAYCVKSTCNRPVCGLCGQKLVKNGKTISRRTRWRCLVCGTSTVKSRPDISARAQADLFIKWLLKGYSVNQLGLSRSLIPTRITSHLTLIRRSWKMPSASAWASSSLYQAIINDSSSLYACGVGSDPNQPHTHIMMKNR